jgi:hypothetical protein
MGLGMWQQSPYFLILCILVGLVARYFPSIPEDTYRKINRFIIWIPLPAITLEKIPQIALNGEVIFPVISAWWVFLFGASFFGLLSYLFRWDIKTWAVLTMVCGLGNTSFVGYPVVKMVFGEESLKYAIFVDQPGTFLCLSTLGVAVGAIASSGSFQVLSIFKRLIQFPPFPCFLIALMIPVAWLSIPVGSTDTGNILSWIGSWMTPLAFISVGMQFKPSFKDVPIYPYLGGIFYKLILAPLSVWLIFLLLGKSGELFDVTVLELAMPPMITASIIAIDLGLKPTLANALINFGIPTSALTLFIWSLIL